MQKDHDITSLRTLVDTDLKTTNRLIDNCLHSELEITHQLGHHLIGGGGKRLRPLVVLLCAHAMGYQGEAHTKVASAVELIHTASLLHDDVVDTSDLRRGRETANKIWGNAPSVLVGDFLYSRAFQLMVETESLPVMQIFANATNTIAKGELLQLLNCKDPETSEELYMEVLRAKTGTLFAAAAQTAPMLCNAPTLQSEAMYQYGMNLGVAFQLADDALDYSADSQTLGKNQGDDLAEGKPTLPLLHAIKHGTAEERHCIRDAIRNADRAHLPVILAAIESTQAIAYTYNYAKQHAEKAIASLDCIPDSPYRDALISLAGFVVQRSY